MVVLLAHLVLALGLVVPAVEGKLPNGVAAPPANDDPPAFQQPGSKPEVCFALCEGDEVEAVYAYCNLHSLWKA